MPKKSTYTKKTDSQKPWAKKSKTSEYKIETVDLNKTILIVCEGENSEPLYFKAFEVLTLTVEVIGLGESKLKLVEDTKCIQAKENYDAVWCVFDLDIKGDVENCISDFNNAIASAKNLGYKVAYSNDAFELWFYLHYYYTDCENHRTFYYEKLSHLWNINYEKEGKKWKFSFKIYEKLQNDTRASQTEAIKRAKKLHGEKIDLSYHLQNPVTTVYELVEYLNDNTRK